MNIFRKTPGKKEAGSKNNPPAPLPDPTPANKITREELNSLIQELVSIDQTDGLMQNVDRELPDGRIESTDQPHPRGREIGQILADSVCDDGGNITGDLMHLAYNTFIEKGGTDWRLDACWDDIKNGKGKICWRRHPPLIAGPG